MIFEAKKFISIYTVIPFVILVKNHTFEYLGRTATVNKQKFYIEYFNKFREKISLFKISKLKQPIVRIL